MKIQAAVLHAPGTSLTLEMVDMEAIRDDEILVRLVATGVCHTDISMMQRPFPVPQPIVLGHEGAGVVESVGAAVSKVKVGDHVVMSFNSCGYCDCCQEHETSYCHHSFSVNFLGQRSDGSVAMSKDGEAIRHNFFGQSSFASHSICNERNVVRVPSDLPLEMLGPLACGFQTGAGAVINVLRPRVAQSMVVFGAGSVGMAAIMAAKAIGVTTLIAVDIVDERLALASELGATHTLNPKSGLDVVAELKRITKTGVHFAFDTTGRPQVVRQAVDALAPRGMCGYVGGSAPGTELALDMQGMMVQGKTLRGIIEGDANSDVFIPALIQLYRLGRFPFDKLITYYPFESLNEAIADSVSGKVVKPVVRMA